MRWCVARTVWVWVIGVAWLPGALEAHAVPVAHAVHGVPGAPDAQHELAAADSLDRRFVALEARGRYAESREVAVRQLEIRRRLLGPEHPAVAASLHHLGLALWRLGRYPEADAALREALAMRRRLLGDAHPAVATTESDLGRLLWYRGENGEAERLFRDALERRRRLHGDRHPEVATSLHDLGLLLGSQGEFEHAEACLREALAIRRQLYAGDHADIASSLINLGILLRDRGEYAGAERLLREELAMRRRLVGDEHPEVASSLENLGLILMYRGRFGDAEPLLRAALAMHRRLLGDRHPEFAASLDNLGFLLLQQGNFADAEALLREALALRGELLGRRHPFHAKSMHNLGLALWRLGQDAEAERLLRTAVELVRSVRGEEHIETTAMIHNLGLFLWDRGRFTEAETLLREELEINRRTLGGRHPDVVLGLVNLAGVIMDQGRLAEPERYLREALAASDTVLGAAHPYRVAAHTGLGAMLDRQGRHAQAEAALERAAAAYETARQRAGSGLVRSTFQQSPYNRLALARLELGRTRGAWEAAELQLGRVLAELLHAAGERAPGAAESARRDSLAEQRSRLAGQLEVLERRASSDTTPALHRRIAGARTELLETGARWSALEQAVAGRQPIGGGRAASLERVQAALPARTAIVGWLDVEQPGGEIASWGYVIRDEGPAAWRRLGDDPGGRPVAGTPFERAHAFRARLALGASLRFRVRLEPQLIEDARSMWRARFAPLTGALAGIDNLVVIPSGAMLGLPVEAFAGPGAEFLGGRFAVSYAPSATVYAWLHEQAGRGGARSPGTAPAGRRPAALLVGDPQLARTREHASMEPVADASRSLYDPAMLRSAAAGNREALDGLWPLPWSRVEVEGIAEVLPRSTVLLGGEASEPALDAMARAGRLARFGVIHLATHALVDDERPERSALVLSRVDLPDPLAAAMRGEKVFNGLLTAGEIVRDWDLDAELVTLSACETALGREAGGEGYVGFAHAFLQAGARSLLVSLWPVNDEATALLMRRFYTNLYGPDGAARAAAAGARRSKARALRDAKEWLRGTVDAAGQHPFEHPYYWAGFILFGESQ